MTTTTTTKKAAHPLDDAKVGDGLTHCIHTDCHAMTIISRTATRITARRDRAILLNGVGSGEPDAITFEPGGFVGHWSGEQRYRYEPDPNGEVLTFSRRKIERAAQSIDEAEAWGVDFVSGEKAETAVWKLSGHPTRSPGHVAWAGRSENYDFNY